VNWLNPVYLVRTLGRVLRGTRFLIKTRAPRAAIWGFAKGRFVNDGLAAPYRERQKAFRAEAKSLELSNDWFTKRIPMWLSAFEECGLVDRPGLRALEIGSWEGLSSYFILHSFPGAHLTCVDTWEGGDEHKAGHAASEAVLSRVEQTFDGNLSRYRDRLTKFRGTSFAYFAKHGEARGSLDLVYVDGSHHCDDVVVDAFKGFEMLRPGGVLIFDDYFWKHYPRAVDNPAGAINAFLQLKKGSYRVVRVYYQLIIQKLADDTEAHRGAVA
jgi:predicted O-methyltransferase YrrM